MHLGSEQAQSLQRMLRKLTKQEVLHYQPPHGVCFWHDLLVMCLGSEQGTVTERKTGSAASATAQRWPSLIR